MHLELPQELIDRVQQRTAATAGATEADVIRQALDSLDWHDQERLAIEEGIDAWRAGDVRDLAEFDRDFRAKNGIPADA
jgi:Arc/MetJ-type ribon-helix-helix transcriptional regulator